MRIVTLGLSLAVAAAVSLGPVGIPSALAGEHEYKPKVEVTDLIQEALPGVAGKTVIIKHFDIPAGHLGGRHSHPGPVYVYVVDGELTIETEGDDPRTIKAGELYKEPLGRVMQARNMRANAPVRIVVFQVGDEGKPMMLKAE